MHANFEVVIDDKAILTNLTTPLRVLLVDDEKTMHEMLRLGLKNTEYDLVSVTGVDDAIREVASSYPPDIVITDAMMPGASGFSLITYMKSHPTTSDIPIILWTVLVDINGDVLDSSGKADFTMSKPFNLTNLLASLSRARRLIKTGVEITF